MDKHDRLTPLYGVVDGKIEKSSEQMLLGPIAVAPEDVCRDNLRFHMGGAGLVSTTDDYLRFGMMLANRGTLNGIQLLRPSTVDLMATNATGDLKAGWLQGHEPTRMGLGAMLVHNRPGPAGPLPGEYFVWFGGFGLLFWADTAKNAACVMMSQRRPDHAEFKQYCRVLTTEAIAGGI